MPRDEGLRLPTATNTHSAPLRGDMCLVTVGRELFTQIPRVRKDIPYTQNISADILAKRREKCLSFHPVKRIGRIGSCFT